MPLTTLHLFLLLLIITLLTIIFMRQMRFIEQFGTSPGTLQQLASTHVPTKSDLPSLRAWLDARDRGIRQMTGQPELIPCGAIAPAYSMRLGAYA
jgi:hypothetical protein